jgi:hypothetical protein
MNARGFRSYTKIQGVTGKGAFILTDTHQLQQLFSIKQN